MHSLEHGQYLRIATGLLRHKLLILSVVVVSVCGAGLVGMLSPDVYDASILLMPEVEPEDTSSPLRLAVGLMTQKRALMPGPEILCLDLLSSERLLDAVIDRLPELSRMWGDMHKEDMRKTLLSCCRFGATPSGLVRITARTTDAQSSATLANTLATELQRLYRSMRSDKIRREIDFLDRRLAEASRELAAAEERLAEFQRTRKMLRPDESATATFSALISLEARVIEEEARLQVLKSYASAQNPQVRLQEEVVKALRKSMAGIEQDGDQTGASYIPDEVLIPLERLPEVGLEGVRIERKVHLHEKLYLFLMERHESLKLAEAKEASALVVLKKAEAPEASCGPRRGLWIALAALVGLVAGSLSALAVEHLRGLESTEEGRKTLAEFKKSVWRGG